MQRDYDLQNDVYKDETVLTIVVVGASGDLARKKIFPALFALYYQGLLPKHVQIVGYARSKTTTEEFREKIYSTLGCRIDAKCAPVTPPLPVISQFSLSETQKIVLNIHNFSIFVREPLPLTVAVSPALRCGA